MVNPHRKKVRALLVAAIVLVVIFLALGVASICLANKPCKLNLFVTDRAGNLCPTAGPGVVVRNQQYVPNLVDTQPPVLGVEASTNRVVPLAAICPDADFANYFCTEDNNKLCKSCNKSTPVTYDPSTWVTCSPSECQGSLSMKPQQDCTTSAISQEIWANSNNSQRGVDMKGMFGCLSGKGNNCTFDNTMGAACQSKKCSAFTVSSDWYDVCDASGTESTWDNDTVAFDPFGHDISNTT